MIWQALALSFVLFAGAGLWLTAPGAPELPAPPDAGALRGGLLTLTSPTGVLSEFPRTFRWRGMPEAASYRVVVRGVDGVVLWQGSSGCCELAFGDELLSQLYRSVVYHWQVEALDGSARVVADSEELRFLIKPKSGAGAHGDPARREYGGGP